MTFPFLKQIDKWDCSIACIVMINQYFYKKKINYSNLLINEKYYEDLNLIEIETMGTKLGINLTSYFVEWKNFNKNKNKYPIICQIKNKEGFHFIVIYKKQNNNYLIADPSKNEIKSITEDKLKENYIGVIITSEMGEISINDLLKTENKINFLNKISFSIISLSSISILSSILIISLQFLMKIIIDEILIKKTPSLMMVIFISFFIIFLGKLFLTLIFEKLKLKIGIYYKKRWNKKFFHNIRNLNYIDFKKFSTSTILQNFKHFNKIINFYFPESINLFHNIFLTIITLIILSTINVWIILLIILFWFVNIIFYIFVSPILKNIHKRKIEKEKKFSNDFLNYIENQNDLKRRNLLLILNNSLNNSFENITKIYKKEFNFKIFNNSLISSINFIIKIITIYIVVHFSLKNSLKPGYFIFLISLIQNIIGKSWWFLNYINNWNEIKKIREEILPFFIKKKIQEKIFFWKNKNELNINNLNFTYKNNNFVWKNNLNFTIKKNTIIDGNSGVGKTTLLQIIAGELNINIGFIKINNINNIEQNQNYQKNITFISNKSKIFPGTVQENIINFEYSNNLLNIFKKEKLNIFLNYVKLNLFENITNNTISGGQRQIIIFLSLFFVKTKIILLDECLNSIPELLKIKLIKKLLNFQKKKLIIMVTHNQKIKNLFINKIILNEK